MRERAMNGPHINLARCAQFQESASEGPGRLLTFISRMCTIAIIRSSLLEILVESPLGCMPSQAPENDALRLQSGAGQRAD
jgi:hypothetical protein